jgi:hypothetical protein
VERDDRMTNKLPCTLFLALVLVGSVLVRAQPRQVCVDCCIDPSGTPIPTCTPTPIPHNPAKWMAGGQVYAEIINAEGRHSWTPYIGTTENYESIAFVRDGDDMGRIITDTWKFETLPSERLGGDSDYVIIINEPGYPRPAGSDMSLKAEVLTWALARQAFPNHKLIVGNYSQENYTRIEDAWALYVETYNAEPPVAGVGFHCYFYDGYDAPCRTVVNYYAQFKTDHDLDQLWMTEWGSMASVGSAGVNWGPAVAAIPVFADYAVMMGVDRLFWYPYGFPPGWTSAVRFGDDLPGDGITPSGQALLDWRDV